MGMFDFYIPDPPVPCPKCGKPLEGWQGKNSLHPALFVWKQRVAKPIGQEVDDECKCEPGKLATFRLDDGKIEIYGGSCSCGGKLWGPLVGFVQNGVWETLDQPPSQS